MTSDDQTGANEYVSGTQGCIPTLLMLSVLVCLAAMILAFILSHGFPAGIIPVVCGLLLMLVFGWRWLKAGSIKRVSHRYYLAIEHRYDAEMPPFEGKNRDPSKMVECYVKYEAAYGIWIGLLVTALGLVVLLFAR